jgi:hypothetical protein
MATIYSTPREALRDLIRDRLDEKLQDVEGGPWDGVRVITHKDLDAVFAELELPDVSDHSAEVATPARIVVAAYCPKCQLPTDAAVRLTTTLTVDATGSEVKVKSKTAAVPHACGQTVLSVAADGQQAAFEIGDIVGDAPTEPTDEELLGEADRADDAPEDDDLLPG